MNESSKCFGYKIGDSVSMKRVAASDLVLQLADISGDQNPIHTNEEYAKKTIFGKRIAHGLFCLGMVSNLIGTKLPGEGAILVNEQVNYLKPVYIDDEIETTVEITEIIYERNKMMMKFECKNQDNEVVLNGSTLVKIV
jgi:acyl dehydratase